MSLLKRIVLSEVSSLLLQSLNLEKSSVNFVIEVVLTVLYSDDIERERGFANDC